MKEKNPVHKSTGSYSEFKSVSGSQYQLRVHKVHWSYPTRVKIWTGENHD